MLVTFLFALRVHGNQHLRIGSKTLGKQAKRETLTRTPQKGDTPKNKRRRIEEHYNLPEGETEETCKEHVQAM